MFAITQIVSLHLRSDGGIVAALDLDSMADNIKAAGFPFLMWEEGGFAYRKHFSPLGLAGNVVVAAAAGASVAIIINARHGRRGDG